MSEKTAGPAVSMRGICKSFPGVVANDCVDFEARRGEIHALLGENGAGKSTLMHILSGLYRPDAGEILMRGRPVEIRSPRSAIRCGVGMVHQQFMLVDRHTVAENVFLGLQGAPFVYRCGRAEKVVRDVSARYGLAVEPGAGIWELSVGEQQRVEIIKMLLRNVSVLILDEPTAVLTPSETDALFATMRGIAGEGRTIIFISHKLREVMQISDRITIMRKGRKIITLDTESTDERDLAHHMIGGDVAAVREPSGSGGARPVVELRGLWARSDRLLDALKGIDLTVHEAEIVGVAGVSGNGQKELEEVLAGLRPSTRGAVWLTGKDLSGASPAEMISQGLGCIPGDRHKVGTASGLGAVDNLILKRFRMPPIASGILLDYREATLLADELIEGYRIAVPDASAPVRLLSGGNLQKIILARELYSGPRFLLAVHPTRGLDVGAAQFIRNALLGLKETGAGILLISEDLEEICALSDRVAVMYGGRIMGVLPRGEATMERLGLLMTGQHCGI